MRIYNGKKSQIDLPLSGDTRITVPPLSVSKDMMPSDYFLTLMAQSYGPEEVALIVAGPYEINMCAKNPACTPMVVQSLDEAIARFNAPAKAEPAPKHDSTMVEKLGKINEAAKELDNSCTKLMDQISASDALPSDVEKLEKLKESKEKFDDMLEKVVGSNITPENARSQFNNYGGNKKKNKGNKSRPTGNVSGFGLGSNQEQA